MGYCSIGLWNYCACSCFGTARPSPRNTHTDEYHVTSTASIGYNCKKIKWLHKLLINGISSRGSAGTPSDGARSPGAPGSLPECSVKSWGQDRMNKADRDKFIEELAGKIGFYEGLQGDLYKESLGEQFALAKRFYESLLGPDGIPKQLFEDIAMSMDADVMGWIVELPFALADHASMADEAVEIGNLFAAVYSPDNFFGDMAAILAEAGRREEALERIARNLQVFPDDAWIIIKAGQAYQTLKEMDKAIELYNRAYGMTSPLSYDRTSQTSPRFGFVGLIVNYISAPKLPRFRVVSVVCLKSVSLLRE